MGNKSKKGKLFIVSTPIGNKEDITLRALGVLKICDFVICEELKEGARLLKNINLEKELVPLNEQNEIEQTFTVLERLEKGDRACLVSDCGTPLLADPGHHLLKAALRTDIEIEVVPGASSILTAIVRSGFEASSFFFAGMLSRKEEDRVHELTQLSHFPKTVILLETPYRLKPLLEAAARVMPERRAYIGMNLTMMYETHHYGTFAELYEKFKDENIKAEFVICFEGHKQNTFSKAADKLYRQSDYSSRPRNKNHGNFKSDRKYKSDRNYKSDKNFKSDKKRSYKSNDFKKPKNNSSF